MSLSLYTIDLWFLKYMVYPVFLLLFHRSCVKPTELLKMSDKEYILMVIQAPQVKPSMKKEDAKA